MTANLSGWLKKTNEIESVIKEIMRERVSQDAKWGEQNLDPFTWLAILGEEVGEANKAALEAWQTSHKFDVDKLKEYRAELLQVAAVAVAMIQCLDRGKWLNPKGDQ